MIPAACLTNPNTFQWSNSNLVNGDTAMGMPWFHENRFIGRAAFTYSFEPIAHSK